MHTNTHTRSLLHLQLKVECLDDLIERRLRAAIRVPPSAFIIRDRPHTSGNVYPFRERIEIMLCGGQEPGEMLDEQKVRDYVDLESRLNIGKIKIGRLFFRV